MTSKQATKILRPEMEVNYNGLYSIVKSVNSMHVTLNVLATPVLHEIKELKLTTNYVNRLLNSGDITIAN